MSLAFDMLRRAFRVTIRQPGVSIVTALLLAFSVAATTALLAVVKTVVWNDLNYRAPSELVWIWSTRPTRSKAFYSVPDFIHYRDNTGTLDQFVGFHYLPAILTGAGEPERVNAIAATANAFDTLGARPMLGKAFLPTRDGIGQAVLTHSYWAQRFSMSETAVGQTIQLSGSSYRIVGVMPKSFRFPGAESDLAMITLLDVDIDPMRQQRDNNFIRGFGRLKVGVSLAQAEDEFESLTARLRETYPDTHLSRTRPRVVPLKLELHGDYQTPLKLLLAATGVLMALVFANLSSLLVAHAIANGREIAIRLALGATPLRIAVQTAVEGWCMLLPGVFGTAIALPLVWRGVEVWAASALPPDALRIDLLPLMIAALVTGALVAAMSSLVATLIMSRSKLRPSLRDSSKGSAGSRVGLLSLKILIGFEVALAVVMLSATVALLTEMQGLYSRDKGFDERDVASMRMAAPTARYPNTGALMGLFLTHRQEVSANPHVKGVAMVNLLPLAQGVSRSSFRVSGRELAPGRPEPSAHSRWITPGYFDVIKLPIVAGRDFSDADREDSLPVAIINEVLAGQLFNRENPLGAKIEMEQRQYQIVGVVRASAVERLDEPPQPILYLPASQVPASVYRFFANRFFLVYRTSGDMASVAAAARQALTRADAGLPVPALVPMRETVASSLGAQRMYVALILAYAMTAVCVVAVGAYALLARIAIARAREFAVRRVLGASTVRLTMRSIGDSCLPGMMGGVAGIFAALFVLEVTMATTHGNLGANIAYGALAFLILLTIILVASLPPALRAAMANPATQLRAN